MASSETACLLGLPKELRCQIYEYIIMMDLSCDRFEAWRDGHRFGKRAYPQRGSVKLSVPWIHMQSTCRTTYSELKDFMCTGTIVNNLENRTWKLNLPLLPTPTLIPQTLNYRFGSLTWQRLPCAPHSLCVLHLKMRIPKKRRTYRRNLWRDEYNAPQLHCKLYQIIRHMLNYDPLIDVSLQHSTRFYVEKVILELDFEADHYPSKIGEIDHWTDRDREDCVNDMYGEIRDWCRRGLGKGMIDRIEIVSRFGTSTLQV